MSEPRVAIIGAGWIAEHGHLPAYREAGVPVVAIADVAVEAARRLAAEFEIPGIYGDWREMLAAESPDVVSICVPNVFHAELAIGAMQSGAHVLCEKPLATSVVEAEAMFRAAREAGVVLMAEQNTRFQPHNVAVREAVETGALGEIYHAEAVYARRLGIPGWGSFTLRSSSFGGALCDIGVHSLDLAIWLMGNPRAVAVSAVTETRFGPRPEIAAMRGDAWEPSAFDVEDFAVALVRLEGGASLSLRAAWAGHQQRTEQYVRLLGVDAGVTNAPPTLFRIADGELVDEDLPVRGERSPGQPELIAHFLAVVAGEAEPLVREEETLNVQRILNAAYESAAVGREVTIDPA